MRMCWSCSDAVIVLFLILSKISTLIKVSLCQADGSSFGVLSQLWFGPAELRARPWTWAKFTEIVIITWNFPGSCSVHLYFGGSVSTILCGREYIFPNACERYTQMLRLYIPSVAWMSWDGPGCVSSFQSWIQTVINSVDKPIFISIII